MNEPREHTESFRIGADHPALPGHFPGAPLVPGVVLLNRVLSCAELWLGRPLSLRSMPQAKFIAPLLPEQSAELHLQVRENELRFTIAAGTTTLAQGLMLLEQERQS
jgi:3-hydroxymyristoyl/3-hydroxydecanoyl-(acyl carrier protein) dehydratase